MRDTALQTASSPTPMRGRARGLRAAATAACGLALLSLLLAAGCERYEKLAALGDGEIQWPGPGIGEELAKAFSESFVNAGRSIGATIFHGYRAGNAAPTGCATCGGSRPAQLPARRTTDPIAGHNEGARTCIRAR